MSEVPSRVFLAIILAAEIAAPPHDAPQAALETFLLPFFGSFPKGFFLALVIDNERMECFQ